MKNHYSKTMRIISIVTLLAFALTQCVPAYALRQVEPVHGRDADADGIGDVERSIGEMLGVPEENIPEHASAQAASYNYPTAEDVFAKSNYDDIAGLIKSSEDYSLLAGRFIENGFIAALPQTREEKTDFVELVYDLWFAAASEKEPDYSDIVVPREEKLAQGYLPAIRVGRYLIHGVVHGWAFFARYRKPFFDSILNSDNDILLYEQNITAGWTFRKACDKLSLKVNTTGLFTKTGYIPKIGEAGDFANATFSSKPGRLAGKASIAQGAAIIFVLERIGIDEEKFKKEKDEFRKTALEEKQSDYFEEYFKTLKQKANIRIAGSPKQKSPADSQHAPASVPMDDF